MKNKILIGLFFLLSICFFYIKNLKFKISNQKQTIKIQQEEIESFNKRVDFLKEDTINKINEIEKTQKERALFKNELEKIKKESKNECINADIPNDIMFLFHK